MAFFDLYHPTKRSECPLCGYPDGLSVSVKNGKQLAQCFACNDKNVYKAVFGQAVPLVAGVLTTRNASKNRTETAVLMWQQSQAAAGSPVEKYLRFRNYHGPIPQSLRYLPHASHWESGEKFPAMIGCVANLQSNTIVGTHRTFLKPDGYGKADVIPAKKSKGEIGGGGVCFGRVSDVVQLTEGIETGLACFQSTGIPTIACLSTSGLRKILLPQTVKVVTICADSDKPGIDAADEAASRLYSEGCQVRIAVPPCKGKDWADVMAEGVF